MKNERIRGQCLFCNKHTILCNSHIIPRAFLTYLKKKFQNYILSDMNGEIKESKWVIKGYYFCEECEQLFNTFETYFFGKIFHQIRKNPDRVIDLQYDRKLIGFILTLNWRIYYLQIKSVFSPDEIPECLARRNLSKWKNFINIIYNPNYRPNNQIVLYDYK